MTTINNYDERQNKNIIMRMYLKSAASATNLMVKCALFITKKTCLLIVKKVNLCDLLKETCRDTTMSRMN